jgi:hypothetical protein
MTTDRRQSGGVALALAIAAAVAMPAMAADTRGAPARTSGFVRYHPESLTQGARVFYKSQWGVDNMRVQRAASGKLVRFSYRVVDPARATVLNAERDIPYLIDPKRNVVLQVPKLEQVGDLRQKGTPVAGMTYWMAFSNKNEPVKAGDRVSIAIGTFRADGLIVE